MRAALAGLGNIAWKYDMRARTAFAMTQGGAMRERPDVELVGGCSPDAGDRRSFAAWMPGTPVYASLEEMLDDAKPDLVGVCSPTERHFEHASLCLRRGVRMP